MKLKNTAFYTLSVAVLLGLVAILCLSPPLTAFLFLGT
jgi:hypothetical protein